MDDTSGKFALVVLRAKQVRVHHKRTKHEYVFRISDNRIEVAECLLHPNHAAPVDPRDYREEAQAAAEWFVEKRSRVSANVLDDQPRSGWVAAYPVGWQRSLTSSVVDGAALAAWQIEHTSELFQVSRNSG
jgi:hypothetical protein